MRHRFDGDGYSDRLPGGRLLELTFPKQIKLRFPRAMNGTQIREISPEVLYSDGRFLAVGHDMIVTLKERARVSERKRCRLCFHTDADSAQQEMLIVMHKSSYVRPHRHIGKSETLTVIDGRADAVLFDSHGAIKEFVPMSSATEDGMFFYKMPEGIFHTLIFRSEWFVFLETTIGPFDPNQSTQAEWAPPETDQQAGHSFIRNLKN